MAINGATLTTTFFIDTVQPDSTSGVTTVIPAVGDMSSYVAIWINNTANKYTPPAARLG
jgi:hypothetical protein